MTHHGGYRDPSPPKLTASQRRVLQFIEHHSPLTVGIGRSHHLSMRDGRGRITSTAWSRIMGTLLKRRLIRLFNRDGSEPNVFQVINSRGGSLGYDTCEVTSLGREALRGQ